MDLTVGVFQNVSSANFDFELEENNLIFRHFDCNDQNTGKLVSNLVWDIARLFKLLLQELIFSFVISAVRYSRTSDGRVRYARVFPLRRARIVVNKEYSTVRMDAFFPA